MNFKKMPDIRFFGNSELNEIFEEETTNIEVPDEKEPSPPSC